MSFRALARYVGWCGEPPETVLGYAGLGLLGFLSLFNAYASTILSILSATQKNVLVATTDGRDGRADCGSGGDARLRLMLEITMTRTRTKTTLAR